MEWNSTLLRRGHRVELHRHNKETETLLHISPQRRPVNTALELEKSMEVVA